LMLVGRLQVGEESFLVTHNSLDLSLIVGYSFSWERYHRPLLWEVGIGELFSVM